MDVDGRTRGRMKPRVLMIVGPTSSGKTALGLRLAQERHGEIINADACQMYRGFTIGTGKPCGTWREGMFFVEGIPHHLMDDTDPWHQTTVVEWRDRALNAIRGVVAHNRLPILVGGTGLYVQSLLRPFPIPAVLPQPEWRTQMSARPLSDLVRDLQVRDSRTAARLDLQNPRRVLRALEIATFGTPVAPDVALPPLVDAEQIGRAWPREILYERIDRAVDERIQNGWIQEIEELLAHGVSETAPAMQSIGYREIVAFIKNRKTLEEAVRNIKQATRRYAKRQITWFKRDPGIRWLVGGAC